MHPRQTAVVVLAGALMALDGYDVLSISFASPLLAREWAINPAALGFVLSMELVGMVVGGLSLGAMADRFGRRPIVLLCLGIMALGMGTAALAANVTELSAIRLLTGVGIGGMLALASTLVAESTNLAQRSFAIAAMAAGYPVGAVLGGSIASLLLAWTGDWRAVFLLGAGASLGLIPLVFWLVPETVHHLARRRDIARVNRTLARFGKAPVLGIAPSNTHGGSRANWNAALRPPLFATTLRLILIYFAEMLTFYFLVKWTPKYVVDLGFDSAVGSGVLVWVNVGGLIGAVLVSLATRWVGVRRLVSLAMLGGAASVAMVGQVGPHLLALSLWSAAAGFFCNAGIAGLYAILTQAFPSDSRATGIGLVTGAGRFGAVVGPIIPGYLFAAGWPLAWVAPVMALGSILAASILLGLPRQRKASA